MSEEIIGYVIFSFEELAAAEPFYPDLDNGFWSNEDGWTDFTRATIFEDMSGNLPLPEDSMWMGVAEDGDGLYTVPAEGGPGSIPVG